MNDKATPRPWGTGSGPCGPFLDYQAHGDERGGPEPLSNYDGREPVWLGGDVSRADREFIVRAVNAHDALVAATEANLAWAWAEHNHQTTTFDERMELSNYSQYLSEKAMHGASEDYVGVPHLFIWPTVEIGRKTAEEAQKIVDRVIADYRAALNAKEKP